MFGAGRPRHLPLHHIPQSLGAGSLARVLAGVEPFSVTLSAPQTTHCQSARRCGTNKALDAFPAVRPPDFTAHQREGGHQSLLLSSSKHSSRILQQDAFSPPTLRSHTNTPASFSLVHKPTLRSTPSVLPANLAKPLALAARGLDRLPNNHLVLSLPSTRNESRPQAYQTPVHNPTSSKSTDQQPVLTTIGIKSDAITVMFTAQGKFVVVCAMLTSHH